MSPMTSASIPNIPNNNASLNVNTKFIFGLHCC